ncbi:hypothetical protein [Solirubrum puertoriconensis]|uniref:hypothetical protein n=1 Tax=Solirubrum puertoriconensis TaxID=1751427 RepID=UPI00122E5F31|nr:hypothetical protein [Solirubrum puertoriconensis]
MRELGSLRNGAIPGLLRYLPRCGNALCEDEVEQPQRKRNAIGKAETLPSSFEAAITAACNKPRRKATQVLKASLSNIDKPKFDFV